MRNETAYMKSKRIVQDFSALSFEAGQVRAERRPAIADSRLRLTPVHVRDFNVQNDGSRNWHSPEGDSLAATRHWQQKVLLVFSNDPGFQVAVRQALPRQIELMPVRHVEQALRLGHESYVDAALLDLDLEEDKGWHTAERLLMADVAMHLFLAVAPKGRSELVASVSAGILLEKPLDAAQMVKTLTRVLRRPIHERLQHNVTLKNFLRYAKPLSSVSKMNSSWRCSALNE